MLVASEFDVIIIAGINGAGITRDAALRGLKVYFSIKATSRVGQAVLRLDSSTAGSGISSISSLVWCASHFANVKRF